MSTRKLPQQIAADIGGKNNEKRDKIPPLILLHLPARQRLCQAHRARVQPQ